MFIDFVRISMHPCVAFIALNTIMIFHYSFATDFTGEINNHILKEMGWGYSSRQANYMRSKNVSSVPFIFGYGGVVVHS